MGLRVGSGCDDNAPGVNARPTWRECLNFCVRGGFELNIEAPARPPEAPPGSAMYSCVTHEFGAVR